MTPRLHGYWRSSATWRVRIALHWKGVAFEILPVDLLRDGGEQRAATYLRLAPTALVPSLEIDGLVLSESLAIIDYLETTRPAARLYPASPAHRADALRIAEVVNAGIQPLQNLRTLQALTERFGASADDTRAWAGHWIGEGLQAVERLLEHSSGTHAVGDEVSVADVCLVPQVYNARRFGVDLSGTPRVVAVEAAASALAPFRASIPEAQPDAPSA